MKTNNLSVPRASSGRIGFGAMCLFGLVECLAHPLDIVGVGVGRNGLVAKNGFERLDGFDRGESDQAIESLLPSVSRRSRKTSANSGRAEGVRNSLIMRSKLSRMPDDVSVR